MTNTNNNPNPEFREKAEFTLREIRSILSPSTLVQIVLDIDEAEQRTIEGCPTEEEYRLLLRAQKLELITYLKVSDNIEFDHAPGDGGLRVVRK